MGAISFLRYSVISVLRNRRRSLFAMVGIALALSLMTGSFIAVDSSSVGILRAAIDDVDVDFVAYSTSWSGNADMNSLASAVGGIESVKGVDKATPVIQIYGFERLNPEDNSSYWDSWGGGQIMMVPQGNDWFPEPFDINGAMPNPGTVAIPSSMASELNLDVGDNLLLQGYARYGHYINGSYVVTETHYMNFTYPVSQIWTQEMREQDPYYVLREAAIESEHIFIKGTVDPVVINMEDGLEILDEVKLFSNATTIGSTLNYFIWIDRADVINLADLAGSAEALQFIQNRLTMQGQEYGFYVNESPLVYSLQNLAPQLAAMKVLFLVLSLPVIALGVYLSLVGVDLGITGRRREVGILKSRGASDRQVFGLLMTEAVVLGIAASVIGLVIGLVFSRFLLGSASTFSSAFSSSEGDWSWSDLRVSGGTIVLAVFFGIALMLLSTYRPFKRVSKTPIAETLHHYSKISTQTRYKPWVDFVLLGLSCLSVASILIGTEAIFDQGWSWITQAIVAVVMLLGIVIFPIMPFFLSVGVIRLLTRGSHKLYTKFTALVRPWTKDLTYLVDKNIVRNPRRAANLGVIISLALAFGLFISVTMESSMAYEAEVVKYDVGTDIKIMAYSRSMSPQRPGINYSDLEPVDGLAGVEHAAHFVSLYFSSYYDYVGAAVLNSSEYLDAVKPGDFYFIDHGKGVLRDLEENGTCLLGKMFADNRGILEGDRLTVTLGLSIPQNDSTTTVLIPMSLRVIGLVKALPGLDGYDLFIDSKTVDFMSFQNLSSQSSTVGVFLKVSDGADPRDVAERATALLSSGDLNVDSEVLQDRLDALATDPTYSALSDFLYMEYALAIVIMAVGVGLIIFVAVNDREHELACIMARGSSGAQMRKILMGESMTLMSLGLIVGASVGMLTAYLFNTLFGDQTYAVVERRMVFTYVSAIVVVASIVSLTVASLLATAKAGRMKLSEVLRIRGG